MAVHHQNYLLSAFAALLLSSQASQVNSLISSAHHANQVVGGAQNLVADSLRKTYGATSRSIEFLTLGAEDAADEVNDIDMLETSTVGLCVYGIALSIMALIVTAMFYPMGMSVVCQIIIYVCSLAFVKISIKSVFTYGFKYPKFLTALHLLFSSLTGFALLLLRKKNAGKPILVPTMSELLTGILPIALTLGVSIGAENSALVLVSAAFTEVIASTNPVMSSFLSWAFGIIVPLKLLVPVATVVIGCAISIEGELYFSSWGLALLVLSMMCRGLKAVLQQKLMTGTTRDRFDPITLMAWTCLFSFVELLGYSWFTEGLAPFESLAHNDEIIPLIICIAGSCVLAMTLNMSALFVIMQLGAVGMQMVSQMKSILIVVGGVLLLGESFTIVQQVGFSAVLFGVWSYSTMKRQLDRLDAQALVKEL